MTAHLFVLSLMFAQITTEDPVAECEAIRAELWDDRSMWQLSETFPEDSQPVAPVDRLHVGEFYVPIFASHIEKIIFTDRGSQKPGVVGITSNPEGGSHLLLTRTTMFAKTTVLEGYVGLDLTAYGLTITPEALDCDGNFEKLKRISFALLAKSTMSNGWDELVVYRASWGFLLTGRLPGKRLVEATYASGYRNVINVRWTFPEGGEELDVRLFAPELRSQDTLVFPDVSKCLSEWSTTCLRTIKSTYVKELMAEEI